MHLLPTLVRVALGEVASLGQLYDARTDSFVHLSAFNTTLPQAAITRIDMHESDVKYIYHDTYKEKFSDLGIGAHLGASFLAGFFKVEGSGKYLSERRETKFVTQRSLLSNIQTVSERLEFQIKELEDCISWDTIDVGEATHIVSEIIWGSRNVVTVAESLSSTENSKNVEGNLEKQHSFWKVFEGLRKREGAYDGTDQKVEGSYDVTVVGDVLANDGLVPTNPESIHRYIKNIPSYVTHVNDGKGKPLIYKLMSLSVFDGVSEREVKIPRTVENIETESFEAFVQIFDYLAFVRQQLNDYRKFLRKNRDYVSLEHIRAVDDRISEGRNIETRMKANYARVLQDARNGDASKVEFWNLLEDFESYSSKLNVLESIISGMYREKVQFLTGLISQGARYVGFNGESLDLELSTNPDVDIYVLHFSEAARTRSDLWKQHMLILQQLISSVARSSRIILMDHDALNHELAAPRLELVRNVEVIIPDVLEHSKVISSKCFAQHNDDHLEIGQPKPPQRVAMKIPCPGERCIPSPHCNWICPKCGGLVEYGHIDNFLYCDCGRVEYKRWSFKCSHAQHGDDFLSYDESVLHSRLEALEPYEELNILVLGEAGVGKSTWINAFVNYLTFPTFDEALQANDLSWVTPFTFKTYHGSEDGKFEEIKVSFGFQDQFIDQSMAQNVSINEHDGTSGESAMQRATVHLVEVGKRLIRLIDTPEISDTGDSSQDSRNMADILGTLRQYKNLHGILILLKPNEARIDVMFRFCIQELLTYLHPDAAKNIVFGFTDTRGTSYKPGNTLYSLQTLLDQHEEVDIALRNWNVYCFDSENFRYLAAQKQHNKIMGHLEETRSSWEYSVRESERLLDHFQSTPPHRVTSTVNFYEARRLINQMVAPMAEIAEVIKNTIIITKNRMKVLEFSDLNRKSLEERLKVWVPAVELIPAQNPRTVCTHKDCIEYRSNGMKGRDGMPVLITVHKSLCHHHCYLTETEVEIVGVPGLRHCAAMDSGGICTYCGHPWDAHLHVRHEYVDETMEIDDPAIVAALQSNAGKQERMENVIASMNRKSLELEGELKTIRNAAAQFSIFLARKAITPFNDATLAYLDQQIEQEAGKVQVGGSRDKLGRLTEYRRQYEHEVEILKEHMENGETSKLLEQDGVEELFQRIFSLPHYGAQFQRMRNAIDKDHVGVSEEEPEVTPAKPHFLQRLMQWG